MRAGYPPAVATNRRSRFWWWPLGWASVATVTLGYQFYWSTVPLENPVITPGAGTVSTIGFLTGGIYLLNVLGSVLLFPVGFFHMSGRRRLMAMWAATVAVGIWLQLQLPFHLEDTIGLSGPATWAWGDLVLAAGYLITGAALARIAILASRTPARQATDAPAGQAMTVEGPG